MLLANSMSRLSSGVRMMMNRSSLSLKINVELELRMRTSLALLWSSQRKSLRSTWMTWECFYFSSMTLTKSK